MKTAKWLLVILSLTLVSMAFSQEATRPGEIRFVDGKKQEFVMANMIRHDPSYDAKKVQPLSYLLVLVNKTRSQLLFDKIDSLRVLRETVSDSGVVRGDLEVMTIRGASLTTPISVSEIVVTVYDESGAAKEMSFPFAKDNKLFIRSIVFPKSAGRL